MAAKKGPAAAVRAEQAVEKVATVTVDGAVSALAKVQVDLQKKLGEVSAAMTGALADLDAVNAAIAVKRGELKDLHGIEAAATTLGDLRDAIDAAKAQADRDAADRAEQRKRDEEQYAYRTGVQRRAEEDAHKARLAGLDKQYADRAAALALAEAELAELRKLKADHPALLDAAVRKAEAAVGASLKREFEHQRALADKDNQYKLAEAQRDLAALRAANDGLLAQLAQHRADLAAAHATVKDLGARALDAQSGKATLEAIQRMQETQAAGTAPKAGR